MCFNLPCPRCAPKVVWNGLQTRMEHSDVVEASPVGAAPTTSSFSAQHLASIYWAKTARRDENHLGLGFVTTYIRGLMAHQMNQSFPLIYTFYTYKLRLPWSRSTLVPGSSCATVPYFVFIQRDFSKIMKLKAANNVMVRSTHIFVDVHRYLLYANDIIQAKESQKLATQKAASELWRNTLETVPTIRRRVIH